MRRAAALRYRVFTPPPLPIVERRMTNTDKIKIAAAIAVLVGTGVVLYVKLGRDTSAPKKRKPPEPEPEPETAFAKAVADAIATTKELRPADVADHRHRYFFLHRRALDLGTADHALTVGQGLVTLQDR